MVDITVLMTPAVVTVYGGKHKMLRCHATAFRSGPYKVKQKLESVTNEDSMFIVIIRSKLTHSKRKFVNDRYLIRN